MAQEKDLYSILGVSKTSTQDEIRSAYKKLAMKYHPDRNPKNPSAEEKFKEVAVAYEALGDPDKRKLYDEFGMAALRAGFDAEKARAYRWGGSSGSSSGFSGDASFGGFDIGSLFEQFFRGRNTNPWDNLGQGFGQQRPRAPQKGQDIELPIELDFLEAIQGIKKDISVQGKTLSVTIPPGVGEEKPIRVGGQGEAGSFGGGAGDLLLKPKIRKHPFYRREEGGIVMDLPITASEAYSGGQISVPTPTGDVDLRIPPRSQSGQKLRLKGKGIPASGSRAAVDLLVVLKILLPTEQNPEVEKLLKQLSTFYTTDIRAEIKAS